MKKLAAICVVILGVQLSLTGATASDKVENLADKRTAQIEQFFTK